MVVFINSDKRKIYDFLKSNNLLYLKTPIKKALTVLPSSKIKNIRKKTFKLSRADFKEFIIKLLDSLFIDYKLPVRKKESIEEIKKRQNTYKIKKLKDNQKIQVYVNNKKFERLEQIRIKTNQTKQDFYSKIIENYSF